MITGKDLDTSIKTPKKIYKDLRYLLTNFTNTEYKRDSTKRCCHQQSLQKVYHLPKEGSDETAILRILTELKLKKLLTRKKHNTEDICCTGTKLV